MARVVTLDEMSRYINKNFDNSLQLLTESSLQSYLPFTFVSYSSKDSEYLPYVGYKPTNGFFSLCNLKIA